MRYLTVVLCLFAASTAEAAAVVPCDLRCEYHSRPLAIGTTLPRFSWKLRPVDQAARHVSQSAYEVQVTRAGASFDQDLMWNSGKVESTATDQIPYAGTPLASRDTLQWRVRVWDAAGAASEWSDVAHFDVGLLTDLDWTASWISAADDGLFTTSENIQNLVGDPERGVLHLTPAKLFRKEFSTSSAPVVRATLHATALGVYCVEINGRRVTDERLAPGWSAYQRRVHSQTYDVTDLLRAGENVIGATLVDGWYAGYVAYGLLTGEEGLVPGINGRYYYGVSPALRVQLELQRADGSRETIASDTTWKTALGPITESDILMGERYDARREMPGWSSPGFDDSLWQQAVCKTGTNARIEPHPGVPVRPIEEIVPVSARQREPGVWVYDLGQNISGVVRLKVKGNAGDTVTLRYAEMLHQDGRLSTENLRCARAVDTYVLKGEPTGEIWTPEFTYHGFQYVEAAGLGAAPAKDAITGIVIHSDTPLHGSFTCSDPMLNRLYQNMVWTQRANFFEMPTDCPQRDERMGWTGDAQIYVRAATFNADIASFYTKWLRDLNDDQWDYGAYPPYAPRPLARPNEHHAAGWMDAGVICPWTIWQVYGDTRVIREHWRKMNDFMAWRAARDPQLQGGTDDCGFGDWLSLGDVKTPIPFIDLAYHAYDANLMSQMAAAIGDQSKAAHYRRRHKEVTESFQKLYLQPDGKLGVHNQSAYAMALFFDLIPANVRSASAEHLAQLVRDSGNKMTTGFLGTRPLLPALSSTDHHDLSGVLIRQREFPSWGYEVENGATTIWERWNSYIKGQGVHEPAMNSFSHYAFGAVCEWMMSELVGIDRAAPGFDRVRIAPRPTGGMTYASASTNTRHGKLACGWKVQDGKFDVEFTVPPNTTADVILPVKGSVTESGQDAAKVDGVLEAHGHRFVVGSGTYHFSADYAGESTPE